MQGPSVEETKIESVLVKFPKKDFFKLIIFSAAKMAKKVFERAGGDPCIDKGGIKCSFTALTMIGFGYCAAGGDPASNTKPDQDQFCTFWSAIDFGDCEECAEELLEYFGATSSGLPSECDSSLVL